MRPVRPELRVNPADEERCRVVSQATGRVLVADGYQPKGVMTIDPPFSDAEYERMRAFALQLAAQQAGATTEPERVADAAAEVPFWVTDPRGLG